MGCRCKMACRRPFPSGCSPAVQPAAFPTLGAAGSLVLRRMDRRGHKRGLVRAKKHGTKSGSGASLRRGYSRGSGFHALINVSLASYHCVGCVNVNDSPVVLWYIDN